MHSTTDGHIHETFDCHLSKWFANTFKKISFIFHSLLPPTFRRFSVHLPICIGSNFDQTKLRFHFHWWNSLTKPLDAVWPHIGSKKIRVRKLEIRKSNNGEPTFVHQLKELGPSMAFQFVFFFLALFRFFFCQFSSHIVLRHGIAAKCKINLALVHIHIHKYARSDEPYRHTYIILKYLRIKKCMKTEKKQKKFLWIPYMHSMNHKENHLVERYLHSKNLHAYGIALCVCVEGASSTQYRSWTRTING